MLEQIYDHYSKQPEEMPEQYVGIAEKEGVDRAVCDYIAGMSDIYAIDQFEKLFVPKRWNVY